MNGKLTASFPVEYALKAKAAADLLELAKVTAGRKEFLMRREAILSEIVVRWMMIMMIIKKS